MEMLELVLVQTRVGAVVLGGVVGAAAVAAVVAPAGSNVISRSRIKKRRIGAYSSRRLAEVVSSRSYLELNHLMVTHPPRRVSSKLSLLQGDQFLQQLLWIQWPKALPPLPLFTSPSK